MHNRIHDSVIDLAVQYGAPAVCAKFIGPEIGTGWEYSGKCALRQHYC